MRHKLLFAIVLAVAASTVFLGSPPVEIKAQSNGVCGSGGSEIALGVAQDLVTANADSDDVSVLLGHGDGNFESEPRFSITSSALPQPSATVLTCCSVRSTYSLRSLMRSWADALEQSSVSTSRLARAQDSVILSA